MLNYINLMGRLTKAPELRYTKEQTAVVSFSVACNRDYGEQTDFIDCVAFGKTAEFISKYFDKGSMIVVAGRLQVRDWNDKDGHKRRSSEVIADKVYFGENKKKERDSDDTGMRYKPAASFGTYDDDYDDDDVDLPS